MAVSMHVWGQMAWIDWARHLTNSHPRAIMRLKKQNNDQMVVKKGKEAHIVVDCQHGNHTPSLTSLL